MKDIYNKRINIGIIILSLAIGIGCTNILAVFVYSTLHADDFHENSDQIYALQGDDPFGPNTKMNHIRYGAAEYMKANFSQIDDFCRIAGGNVKKVEVNHHFFFTKPKLVKTSSNFFDFFSYQLIQRRSENVLETPDDIVISEELAKKYFGDQNPIGQQIKISGRQEDSQNIVTGVFQKPLHTTQLAFDMVTLLNEEDSRCYVRLAPGTDINTVERLFQENKSEIPIIHAGTPGAYSLLSLNESYFDVGRRASFEISREKSDVWIALVIGMVILIIAIFNYLGLMYSRLLDRNKECIIRKMNGADNGQVILLLMREQVILILISFALSYLLLIRIVPYFNDLTHSNLVFKQFFSGSYLFLNLGVVLALIAISSIFVSWHVLHQRQTQWAFSGKSKGISFPLFNIFQLTSAILLMICSAVILKQLHHIFTKPIGLDKEVVEIKLPPEYAGVSGTFKKLLEQNTSVESVSLAGASPLLEHFILLLNYEEDGETKDYTVSGFTGDDQYLFTLGIPILEGRNFTGNPEADQHSCLVNQSFVRMFPNRNFVGQKLPGSDKTIIGVVKDFHYSNLKHPIEPAFVGFDNRGYHVLVKPAAHSKEAVMSTIQQTWDKLIPDYPLNVESMDAMYKGFHQENENYFKLMSTCCIISVVLSMMGLFAISLRNSLTRTKEIGIRKVNGAKIVEVIYLLNSAFIKWILISVLLAVPLAWYIMHIWLQQFTVHTGLSWWIFALAGILILFIALITTSIQSYRAAVKNPVEALRYE